MYTLNVAVLWAISRHTSPGHALGPRLSGRIYGPSRECASSPLRPARGGDR